jgi:hypothetical protein
MNVAPKFSELVGRVVEFYGVDNNAFCVKLPGTGARVAFEAMEDEDDGYRSMCEEVISVPLKGHIFFGKPVADVLVQVDDEIDGYRLVDAKTQHVWLRMGTSYLDDYYPAFVFEYDVPKMELEIDLKALATDLAIVGKDVRLNGVFVASCLHEHEAVSLVNNLRIAMAKK